MALVLDTGVLYASLDADDQDHVPCVELLDQATEPLVIPCPVLVELDYLVRKTAGVDPWLAFCDGVHEGAYSIFSLNARHVARAAALQAQFADQPIGFVDAAVVATCEALGEGKVATLDHRNFSLLRTNGGKAFDLFPG